MGSGSFMPSSPAALAAKAAMASAKLSRKDRQRNVYQQAAIAALPWALSVNESTSEAVLDADEVGKLMLAAYEREFGGGGRG